MTTARVDFYLLEASEPQARFQFACRLTEKAYSLQNRVYAHTQSAADAQRLDELLWTFRQGSFVPHQLLTDKYDDRTPVAIGTGENRASEGDLLINLAESAPEFAGGFGRIAEIISGDEASKQAGRERFKYYRELGITPETHTIKS